MNDVALLALLRLLKQDRETSIFQYEYFWEGLIFYERISAEKLNRIDCTMMYYMLTCAFFSC